MPLGRGVRGPFRSEDQQDGVEGSSRPAAHASYERHGELAPESSQRVRVHDLKHTVGGRLRAVGVSFEHRQNVIGHKSGSITTSLLAASARELDRRNGEGVLNRVRELSRIHVASLRDQVKSESLSFF